MRSAEFNTRLVVTASCVGTLKHTALQVPFSAPYIAARQLITPEMSASVMRFF